MTVYLLLIGNVRKENNVTPIKSLTKNLKTDRLILSGSTNCHHPLITTASHKKRRFRISYLTCIPVEAYNIVKYGLKSEQNELVCF